MKISDYTKIALFFIVLGVSGAVYIVSSANGMSGFNTREYETVLSDATGLTTRSKIYMAGVAVGRVTKITLDENEAVLRVAFLKDIELREGAVISRKASSILGTSVLNLDPGSEQSPVVPPGGRLNSSKSTQDMNDALDTVQELGGQISQLLKDFQSTQLALRSVSLETFNSVAEKINSQTDEELERVSRILEATALFTEQMEHILSEGGISGTGPAGDIYTALANLRYITEEINQGRGNIGQAIYDDQFYRSLLASMQQIEIATGKLQTALDTINTVAVDAGEVINSAGVIVDKAAGLNVQVDASGTYLIQANQRQAEASLLLVPTSNDRWYRIGVSSAPDGYATRTVTETVDENGDLIPGRYRDTTETDYSAFLIDAEIARRFGILTLRGGLLENTGGIGLDIQPWRWVSVSGEVFDFKTGEKPNLRATVTVYPFFDPDSNKPWTWIYIKGGVNDSLNDSRDYFVGGGVRFTDTEVKGLIGLIPALNN
jgi:phospholipid/cholesterol/gamma-HCH transport system substrate-binding protein